MNQEIGISYIGFKLYTKDFVFSQYDDDENLVEFWNPELIDYLNNTSKIDYNDQTPLEIHLLDLNYTFDGFPLHSPHQHDNRPFEIYLCLAYQNHKKGNLPSKDIDLSEICINKEKLISKFPIYLSEDNFGIFNFPPKF